MSARSPKASPFTAHDATEGIIRLYPRLARREQKPRHSRGKWRRRLFATPWWGSIIATEAITTRVSQRDTRCWYFVDVHPITDFDFVTIYLQCDRECIVLSTCTNAATVKRFFEKKKTPIILSTRYRSTYVKVDRLNTKKRIFVYFPNLRFTLPMITLLSQSNLFNRRVTTHWTSSSSKTNHHESHINLTMLLFTRLPR